MPRLRGISDVVALLNTYQMIAHIEKVLKHAGCSSVLDVGCGAASPLRMVRCNGRTTGLDAYLPAVEASRAAGLHDEYLTCDLREVQPPKSFDAVVALEVIEHLPKQHGDGFLNELERLARKLVIISTPNGFVAQGPVGGNELQRHLSGWTAQELRERGYTVNGILGAKPLRGEEARLKIHPSVLGACISKVTEPFVWTQPERAFGLLAYKHLA